MNSITKPKLILLHGFRATGKSTLAPMLASKLELDYLDMDRKLEEKTRKSIAELSENGNNWPAFRAKEHELLQELLTKENLVISTGGGLAVNNILEPNSNSTYGTINLALIKNTPGLINILLKAAETEIAKRIKASELNTDTLQRPWLNSKNATLSNTNLIDSIIADSLASYRQRLPLYDSLADFSIDTTTDKPTASLEKILNYLNNYAN